MNIIESIVICCFLLLNIIALIYVIYQLIVAIKEQKAINLDKKTSFYPIQNDNFTGTKIYFVPTDADIVRETIIRGCVKNYKGKKLLIIDPVNKNFDIQCIEVKDDMHIFSNKADAEAHLQDLLKGGKK